MGNFCSATGLGQWVGHDDFLVSYPDILMVMIAITRLNILGLLICFTWCKFTLVIFFRMASCQLNGSFN